MLPYLQPEHDRAVAMAHAAVGPHAFTTAWAEGRTIDFDRATELALTRDEPPPVRR